MKAIEQKRPKLDKKYQSQQNTSPTARFNKTAAKVLNANRLLTLPNEKSNTDGMRPDSGAQSRKKKKLIKGASKILSLTDKSSKKKSLPKTESLEVKEAEFYEPVKLDEYHRNNFYRNKDIFEEGESLISNRTINLDSRRGSSEDGLERKLTPNEVLNNRIEELRLRKNIELDIQKRRDLLNL